MKLPAKQTEKDFQRTVIAFAKLHRWRVGHFRPVCARRPDGSVRWQTPVQADGAGMPDLVLVRERVVFAELKMPAGRLSADQEAWLTALRGAGVEAYIWRPTDWPSIERVLAGVPAGR